MQSRDPEIACQPLEHLTQLCNIEIAWSTWAFSRLRMCARKGAVHLGKQTNKQTSSNSQNISNIKLINNLLVHGSATSL